MSPTPDFNNFDLIRDRLSIVLEEVRSAARSVGRSAETIRLVVVTKGHSIHSVEAVVEAGVRILGESYAEEGVEKIRALGSLTGVEWHMIGHIQSRKTQMVCEHFNYVHSADRIKIIKRLNRCAKDMRKSIPILLECNISGEESKYGLAAWDEKQWAKLSEYVEACMDMPNLKLRGLMTIPPYSEDPENSRPYFIKLRRLRDFLVERHPNAKLDELSMGMSADYRIAVQEGATIVRIGTAVMGERPHKDA